MKSIALALTLPAALMLPASALTQAEMLAQLRAANLPLHALAERQEGYASGVLFYARRLEQEGARLLGVTCLAQDGRRMGWMRVEWQGGRVVRVLARSFPGEYACRKPYEFRSANAAETVRWKFEGGAFCGVSFMYSVGELSEIEYGADGRQKTISIIPSRHWNRVLPPPSPPELPELPEFGDAPPPLIDLGGGDE